MQNNKDAKLNKVFVSSFWHPVTNFHKILFLLWLSICFYAGYNSGSSILDALIWGPVLTLISYPVVYFLFWILIRERQENDGFARFAKDVGKAILTSIVVVAIVGALIFGYIKITTLFQPVNLKQNSSNTSATPLLPTYVKNDIYDADGNLKEETKFVFDASTHTFKQNYIGEMTYSASLHNNTSYNVSEIFIQTDIFKPNTSKCDQTENLIDTQTNNQFIYIPASGVKLISVNINSSNLPPNASYCTFVTEARISYTAEQLFGK